MRFGGSWVRGLGDRAELVVGVGQRTVHFTRVDCRDPRFAVCNAVGYQQALAIRVPGEAGGILGAVYVKIELPAYGTQDVGRVEPDEAVLVAPGAAVHGHFVDQRQPAALEADHLGAAAEVLRCDWRGHFGDCGAVFVHHAGWIA